MTEYDRQGYEPEHWLGFVVCPDTTGQSENTKSNRTLIVAEHEWIGNGNKTSSKMQRKLNKNIFYVNMV